jgi:hypothetical protein
VLDERLDRRGLERGPRVLKVTADAAIGRFPQRQGQVELSGSLDGAVDPAVDRYVGGYPRQAYGVQDVGDRRHVLEHERGLDERGDAGVVHGSRGHDDIRERHLAFEDRLGLGAHAGDRLDDGRIARQVAAQHHGVGEEADHILEFLPVTAAGDRADGEIGLIGIAVQQDGPPGEQQGI